jgi:DNA-binding response OmpR family regulator
MISMTVPQYRRRECTLDGRAVSLSWLETELLALLLVTDPERALGKSDIIEALYPNPDLEPEWADNLVYRYVNKLRRHGVPIETEWGFGWRISRRIREVEPMRLAA